MIANDGTEQYDEMKTVHNICPQCGLASIFKLRFKYPNEGSMICGRCQIKNFEESEEREAQEDYLQKLARDIQELKARGLI